MFRKKNCRFIAVKVHREKDFTKKIKQIGKKCTKLEKNFR